MSSSSSSVTREGHLAHVNGGYQSAGARDRFLQLQADHFRRIIQPVFDNLSYVNSNEYTPENKQRFHEILESGIWYSLDYGKTLEKCKLTNRLNWLNENEGLRRRQGFLSTKYFTPLFNPSVRGTIQYSFKLNKGIKPSVALDSIGKTAALLDCGSIYILAFYRALKDFIGVEKFDTLFAADKETPFVFSPDIGASMFKSLFEGVKIRSSADIRQGDKCYFSNIEIYKAKHLEGNAQGHNVMYINNGSTPFFGFGLHPTGLSKEGVERALLNAFNEDSQKYLLLYLAQDKLSWEDFQQLPGQSPAKKDGKLSLAVMRPNIERISRLAEAPLTEVGTLFRLFNTPIPH